MCDWKTGVGILRATDAAHGRHDARRRSTSELSRCSRRVRQTKTTRQPDSLGSNDASDSIRSGSSVRRLSKSRQFTVTSSAPTRIAQQAMRASSKAPPGFERVRPFSRSRESARPARSKSCWLGLTTRSAPANGAKRRATVRRSRLERQPAVSSAVTTLSHQSRNRPRMRGSRRSSPPLLRCCIHTELSRRRFNGAADNREAGRR